MDLSKPISYNSLSVNTHTRTSGGVPMSGYAVDEVDTSEVEVAAYLEKKALSDGIDASDVYLGRRRIAMIVTVFGSTKGDFWDKTQDLLAAFSPTLALNADTANLGFLALDFYQPTADISSWPTSTYPDGIPLRYYVRPTATPGYKVVRDKDGGNSGKGMSKQMSLSLIARDPRKVAQSLTTASTPSAYKGDYPTGVTITLTSRSQTGDGLLQIDNNVLSVNIDTASATYVYTDTGEFYKNGALAQSLVYGNSAPFVFSSGQSGFVTTSGVIAVVGLGKTTYVVSYREAFA